MDKETLDGLFRRYGDDVFRLAYSYLGNRADAEDVCQSVFLKLAENKSVLFPGKEKSWLLTCAANASKNLKKSFWHKNVGELDDTISLSEPQDRDLHAAVMALPPRIPNCDSPVLF